MKEFTIGEVASRTGLPASTIRYYESVGVVPKPTRKNGRRIYSEKRIKWFYLAILAQEGGFTIKETKQIVRQFSYSKTSPSKSWLKAATEKLKELDVRSQRIDQMRQVLKISMGCGCMTIDECADNAAKYFKGEK